VNTHLISEIATTAAVFTNGDGLRSQAYVAAQNLSRILSADISFIARGRADGGVADMIAAEGLGPADFRRLEERVTRSALWRIFALGSPVAIDDVGNDSTLNFLAFGTSTRFLIAVPVKFLDKTIGFVAAGFRSGKKIDEEATIKILEVFAPMIAQAVNAEHASEHQMKRLVEENARLKVELRERFDFSRLIGNSAPMRQVYDQSVQIARSNTTVLIRGESGTGKGLVAQAIHHNSLRAKRPFVRLTCANAALDEKAFSKAEGSTLLLEEVSDLRIESQTKLLNILEDRRERFETNVRFIATSSKSLELLAAKGEMLPGLFVRLARFTITIPPLRERKADILLLAEHFLKKLDAEHKKNVRRISTPAIDMLAAYHFPGNVRELENVVEQALLACDSSVIHGHHLPPTLQTAEVSDTATTLTLAHAVEAFERDLIVDTLKSTEGNIAKAARRLDSTERILGYKIKNYGIEPRRFRR